MSNVYYFSLLTPPRHSCLLFICLENSAWSTSELRSSHLTDPLPPMKDVCVRVIIVTGLLLKLQILLMHFCVPAHRQSDWSPVYYEC